MKQTMQPATGIRTTPAWLAYAVCFALVAAAASVGSLYRPDAWYAGLAKPSWNPPNWIFAPVWTALYVMIAIAGARAWLAGARLPVMTLWGLQLVLNAAWTWTFFGLYRPGLALVDVTAMLAVIVVFAFRAWPVSRISALLFVPYIAWVSFATALNLAIWRAN